MDQAAQHPSDPRDNRLAAHESQGLPGLDEVADLGPGLQKAVN